MQPYKKYVNNRWCALVIHRDPENDCGHVGKTAHIHCIVSRSLTAEANPAYDSEVLALHKKATSLGGALTVQRIRSIFGFVGKMLERPRLFLGANNALLLQTFKAVAENHVSFLPVTEKDCLGDTEELLPLFDHRFNEYNWFEQDSQPAICSTDPQSSTSRATEQGKVKSRKRKSIIVSTDSDSTDSFECGKPKRTSSPAVGKNS